MMSRFCLARRGASGLVMLAAVACGDDDDSPGTVAGAAGAETSAGQGGTASGQAGKSGAAGSSGQGGAAACDEGATRCSASVVERCDDQGQWQVTATCALPQTCREGACAEPSEKQQSQVKSLESFVDTMLAQTGYFAPLDPEAIKQPGRQAIWSGDGSDLVYLTALRGAFLAIPQGHQVLTFADPSDCSQPGVAYSYDTRLGACGRVHPAGLVVTFVRSDNELGLQAGDIVTQAGDDAGPALVDRAALRPQCGDSSPSTYNLRETAAATFFGNVPGGTVLRVQRGTTEPFEVTVPDGGGSQLGSCQDPLGRDIAFNAKAELRADGIGVIRLPRFYPIKAGPTQTQEQVDALVAAFEADVQAAFDQVKSAPGIVWDVRGNGGGITPVGLDIVAGLPGATGGPLSSCRSRIPKSKPPKFYAQDYAEYEVTPGGPFAYTGKVAVVIDSLCYSATDYFARAVATFTSVPLVGSPTAGAYGGTGPTPFTVAGPPAMQAYWDANRCVDADGQPLEGRSVEPTVAVGYAPADLAQGIDTVLEKAVSLVK